mmetsp:Transcript_14114/g.21992  ORF Transcript_14114/g.21992 Transcript_14114/m.21992 type:complete len:146 (-) Transcript_14114:533-970(-)
MKANQTAKEEISVRKKGKETKVMIDHNKNRFSIDYIMNCTNKNKCLDIFTEIRMGQKSKRYKKMIRQKFTRKFKEMIYNKINLVIGLKAIRGLVFLRVLLKKIELARELFLMDIEEGLEVFIPKDLSQDHLPYSFRYYDPIIPIV